MGEKVSGIFNNTQIILYEMCTCVYVFISMYVYTYAWMNIHIDNPSTESHTGARYPKMYKVSYISMYSPAVTF